MNIDTDPRATVIGYCLNCGDKAYEREGHATRHAGTHKIACSMDSPGSPGTCAALWDE